MQAALGHADEHLPERRATVRPITLDWGGSYVKDHSGERLNLQLHPQSLTRDGSDC
jgi:hypothetical protein